MLPRIMRERPNAQFVIAGGDGVSYGASPPKGTTWKSLYLKEVEQSIDPKRLHFVGALGYAQYLQLLQVSSAHVYLTLSLRAVVVDARSDGLRLRGDRLGYAPRSPR